MTSQMSVVGGAPLLALERRRRICAYVRRHGAANVADLAEMLEVAPNTVRRDLVRLSSEGRLTRSHGGALANETSLTRLPYETVSHEHAEQKEWIAEAALALLPDKGSVFLADGTTVLALALRIPPTCSLHVITNSVKIAARLVMETAAKVDVLGGRVRPELLATDCSLSAQAMDMLYWDVAFVGAAALDAAVGITERDVPEAVRQRKLIDHATRIIALCDSSKLETCSYARVGPLDLLDTVVTDTGAGPDEIQAIRDTGVEVVVAGPP